MTVTTSKVRDWLEIVGLFGVIVSLVFVGLQIRQDREIAVAAAYQERAGIAVEGIRALAANEVAMRTIAKAQFGDPDSLIEPEGFAAAELQTTAFALGALTNLMDNSYYQYQAGFLPEDHWHAVRALIKGFLRDNPIWRRAVFNRPNTAQPEFNVLIAELLAEIDAESDGQ